MRARRLLNRWEWNIIIGALSYRNVDIRWDKTFYKKCEVCFLCVYRGVRLSVACARAAGRFPGKAPWARPASIFNIFTPTTLLSCCSFSLESFVWDWTRIEVTMFVGVYASSMHTMRFFISRWLVNLLWSMASRGYSPSKNLRIATCDDMLSLCKQTCILYFALFKIFVY